MDDEDINMGENELSSQLIGLNRMDPSKQKKIFIAIGAGVVALILIIILIVVATSGKSTSESDDDTSGLTPIGEIKCTFDISTTSEPTQILGEDFVKNSKFDIEIDEKKIKFSKSILLKITQNTL